MTEITISLIKADVGGFPGHSAVHPALIETAEKKLEEAKKSGALIDFRVLSCGDDLELLMSHKKGCDNGEVHALAWETFEEATEVAKKLKLYGAGQDLLADAFCGKIVAFMMDKTEPGAFNLPIFRMFADPFNTAGLVIDPSFHHGFTFEVWDIQEHKKVFMDCPAEMYDLLALIGAKSRYVIKRVFCKPNSKISEHEPVAVVSTEKLYQTAGTYVGKDDPVALVRCQSGLPALGEVLEPFALGHLVSGWMRGSHNGPLMPCSFETAHPTRFDGPPRVIAAGFQMAYGSFVGPADLFNDVAFDRARQRCLRITDYMRAHGPFEPHRLPMEDMEYTTLPHVMKLLANRFVKAD
ncbi:MAG: fructose 1,6-bisphosphate aldolase/phosphatase [Methanosaeta sp. NSM2]|nr:fructose-1,6-bisphosphatase [Methanothrix sp.]OYV14377.1 MAG: fructose 1,6-bisphosphate aldolase/phosphatase [Methanosaeta sp. NSM2]